MTLKVSAVSAESPEMDREEFAEFVEDIRANGQRVPIVLCGGEVIDGRKRLAACERLGIKPKTVELEPGADPRVAARSLNVLRTHYSKSQRALFAAARANLSVGNIKTQLSTSREQKVSVEKAAEDAGVSPAYVHQAKRIIREASADTIERVRAGKLTVKAAGAEIDAAVGKRAPSAPRAGRYNPKRAAPDRYLAAVEAVRVNVDYLRQYVADIPDSTSKERAAGALRHIRTDISGIITLLERRVAA